jgi:hypothetical protein
MSAGQLGAATAASALSSRERCALDGRRGFVDRRRAALLGALLWLVAWFGLVPALIHVGYVRGGVPLLSGAMQHRDEVPESHYQAKWARIATAATAIAGASALLLLVVHTRRFRERVVGEATPANLAALRIITCVALGYAAWTVDLGPAAHLPSVLRRSMGVMDLLYAVPAIDGLLQDPAALTGLRAATLALVTLGTVGAFTRISLPLAAALMIVLGGINRSSTYLNHAGICPLYALLVLCFTRCGDALSVDRWLNLRRGESVAPNVPSSYYAWARHAVWLAVVMPYVLAGLSKIGNGTWLWWRGGNLQQLLYAAALWPNSTTHPLVSWLHALPRGVFTAAGVLTLIVELGMVLVLVSRTARRVLPVIAVLMHLCIGGMMGIDFADWAIMQLVFVNWPAITRRRLHEPALKAVAPRRFQLWPIALALAPVLLVIAWAMRCEYYPLTSMQMFSKYNDSTRVSHYRIFQIDTSGRRTLAAQEQTAGLTDRYVRMLASAFANETDRRRCEHLLADVAARWNNAAAEAERICAFEVEKRQWDLTQSPAEVEDATVVARMLFRIGEGEIGEGEAPAEP